VTLASTLNLKAVAMAFRFAASALALSSESQIAQYVFRIIFQLHSVNIILNKFGGLYSPTFALVL